MGYSFPSDDCPRMCFNAAKSWQTGWYADKSTILEPTAIDGNQCFDKNLYGIADYGNDAAETVLIKINDASSTDYYITFNRKSGINSETIDAGNQVTVVRAGGEGNSYSESTLLCKMNAGDAPCTLQAGGKHMKVNVLDTPNNEYAQVLISEDGASCGSPCTQNSDCSDGIWCNGEYFYCHMTCVHVFYHICTMPFPLFIILFSTYNIY